MRAVVYLFSLWFLLLTGLPCPDAECHTHENVAANAAASHPSDDHGHKAPCSPFCHCTTCAGFSIPRLFSVALPDVPSVTLVSQQRFAYHSAGYSDVALAIWQPPKA